METTIDSGGRVVIPKAMRDHLGMVPGSRLELSEVDGRVVIGVRASPKRLVRRHGRPVIVSDEELPELTEHAVRAAVEDARAWPRD